MEDTIKFLSEKAREIGYIDFYNFLVESDIQRKYFLIPKWFEEFKSAINNKNNK
jgi:hypothetical protein